MTLAGYLIADPDIAYAGAHGDHLAAELMADDERRVDGAGRPVVPRLDMQVGAADAGAQHADLYFAGTRIRHGPLDPDLGAIFDPFGNAVHTALMFPLVGEDVLITGAGPIGLMAAAVVRHVGARYVVITDVSESRLQLARGLGVDLALNVTTDSISSAQQRLGMVEGFDVALEMSGHPSALPEVIDNLEHGGRIAMLGLPAGSIDIDWAKVVTHMITIQGIYGRQMFETWYAMSAMLRHGAELQKAITSVVTDRFPASFWADAFTAARAADRGKVVIDWTH